MRKNAEKIDVDFRRTGTLTHYHKLSQAGHAQDQENITPLQKIPNTVHFD